MCDGLVACVASVIISLVTGKNKYEINALRKKASYNHLCTEDVKQKQNTVHSVFNTKLKLGFNIEKKMLYLQYIYIFLLLYLTTSIQLHAVRWGVKGCYTPFHFNSFMTEADII